MPRLGSRGLLMQFSDFSLAPELLKGLGATKLSDYLRDNVEYVYSEGDKFHVDADAKALRAAALRKKLLAIADATASPRSRQAPAA